MLKPKHFLLSLLALAALIQAPGLGAQEFLDPKLAFQPTARALDGKTIEIHYAIAPGYYLYREKFRFAAGDAVTLGTPQFPAGKKKDDETFGQVEVYYDQARLLLPVARLDQSATGPLGLSLRLTSQGCAEAGVCYPPQTQVVTVELPQAGLDALPAPAGSAAGPNTARNGSDQDASGFIAQTLKTAGFWANLAFFFAAGLGLALTPCVLPMIPILSGIIAGQGEKLSKSKGFALSLAYVLGMALTYAAAGVAAGLTGSLLSAALQNPWALGGFALVFVALAFSMFGFYELQLPTSLQSKLSQEAGRLHGGHFAAVFAMGAVSALIVGPCVAAPLAGALLYIGQTGDALFGGSALFVMALGMGTPLFLVGISAGALLPKTGPWMEAVKKGFGVLLLATALWLISPVIPPLARMLGWAALCIVPAIYLRAVDPLPPQAKGGQRFWKAIGILLLLTGAALLAGALAGNRDPLQPLAGLIGTGRAADVPALPFQRVASAQELESRLQSAQQPVMLDFYADWCVSCQEMERLTFADPAVRQRLASMTLLQADVTANRQEDKDLLARFGLFGPPGIIFFDAAGREIPLRVVGFQDAAAFVRQLDKISLQTVVR